MLASCAPSGSFSARVCRFHAVPLVRAAARSASVYDYIPVHGYHASRRSTHDWQSDALPHTQFPVGSPATRPPRRSCQQSGFSLASCPCPLLRASHASACRPFQHRFHPCRRSFGACPDMRSTNHSSRFGLIIGIFGVSVARNLDGVCWSADY